MDSIHSHQYSPPKNAAAPSQRKAELRGYLDDSKPAANLDTNLNIRQTDLRGAAGTHRIASSDSGASHQKPWTELQSLCELVLPQQPKAFWQGLHHFYSQPKRHYHTLEHVTSMLKQILEVGEDKPWEHPKEVILAALYHDAIYEVKAKDNEAQSARLASKEIPKWFQHEQIDIDLIMRLINLTASHGQLTPADITPETARFLDCDMAILGASPDHYQKFAQGVRAEYEPVYGASAYCQGRKQFLEKVLSKERIFLSDYFHHQCDRLARVNIADELRHLTRHELP